MPASPLTPLATAVLRVPAPERALVIGPQVVDAALFLAREFPTARIRGASRAQEAVRQAVEQLGLDPDGRLAFKHVRARTLPYPDDFFDLVVIQDVRVSAAELARTLRAGGHLLAVRTRAPSAAGRGQDALLRRRLRRHGIEPTEAEDVVGGNFLVARLRAESGQASGN